MSDLRRLLADAVFFVLIVAGAIVAGLIAQDVRTVDPHGRNEIAQNGTVQGRLYLGDPATEPRLVAAEQQRIDLIRSTAAAVPWRISGVDGPYRMPGETSTTLVLTPRPSAYTLDDLKKLAPRTFVAEPDGSYLLSENVVALPGAALDLSSSRPVTIAMVSSPQKFVSIVTTGGAFTAVGGAAAPISFVSRDPATGSPDTTTADGRAYVRIIGGAVRLQDARFSDLGFWSGETGGLALTGVDEGAQPASASPPAGGSADLGTPTLSADQLKTLTGPSRSQAAGISGSLTRVSVTRDAFGLFLTQAANVEVADSRISGSLIDGIVLHRFVTATSIRSTVTTDNAVDGLSIARSSASITLKGITSSENGRNGVSIDGQPLADGPSADGAPTVAYGDIHLDAAKSVGNSRYGIEITGARGVSVTGSTISRNVVGVAVDHAASDVVIARNTIDHQSRQAITVSGGVTDASVSGNRIASVDTGARIDGSQATIDGNTFTAITRHAVTLVGAATGTRVVRNTMQGTGSAPVFSTATGARVARNDVGGWRQPVTARSILNTIAQPLTLVWVLLGVLLILTAVLGHRRRGVRDPFANRAPLTALTRGIVSRDEATGVGS